MKKNKLHEGIIKELVDNGSHHICCLIDGDNMGMSLRCSEEELYAFLYVMCKNAPWARDVIMDFIEDYDAIDIEIKDNTLN